MSDFLRLEQIEEKIKNREYYTKKEYPDYSKHSKLKEDYITDEDQSVKWNKEQVRKHNLHIDEMMEEYRKDEHRLDREFTQDVINMVMNVYSFNEKQAHYLFNEGWRNGHSDGLYSVVNKVDSLANFIKDFMKLN